MQHWLRELTCVLRDCPVNMSMTCVSQHVSHHLRYSRTKRLLLPAHRQLAHCSIYVNSSTIIDGALYRHMHCGLSQALVAKAAHPHGNSANVQRHERVGGHEQVEQPRHVVQARHVVRKPGDVPAQRKVRQQPRLDDVLRQLSIRLQHSVSMGSASPKRWRQW